MVASTADLVVEMLDLAVTIGDVSILENVSMTIERGDFLAILGPNGGGKSTLLKVMLGLLKPTSGTVRVLGREPGDAGGRIGYLPQHTHVSPSFPITVAEAVRMGTVRPGLGGSASFTRSKDEAKLVCQALDKVGMLQYEKRSLAGLSGGQKQRVFIARALVSLPELLILDEPTASVDPESRNALFKLLADLNAEMTIIMVSHDISSLVSGVKSVACVNRDLHFHNAPEITGEMFKMTYGSGDTCCPVELVTHGAVPHRILRYHEKPDGEEA